VRWQDSCLAYFQTFAKRPVANGYQPKYPPRLLQGAATQYRVTRLKQKTPDQ